METCGANRRRNNARGEGSNSVRSLSRARWSVVLHQRKQLLPMGFDGRDVVRRQALMRLHLQLVAERTQPETAILNRPSHL